MVQSTSILTLFSTWCGRQGFGNTFSAMGTQIWTTVCGGPQHDQYRRSPGFGQGDMESRKHGQSCNHMDVCHSSLGFLGREADLQRGISLWIGVTSTPQLLIHGEVIFFCLRNCCLCAVHQSVKEVRCAKKQRETRNKQKSENKQTNKQTKPHTKPTQNQKHQKTPQPRKTLCCK